MKTTTRWTIAIATLLIIGGAATFAYFTWWQPKMSDEPDTKTTDTHQTETPKETSRTFTSANGVTIQLDNWPEDGIVPSPLTITGSVPGSWSFEGSFPIEVIYEGDIGLPGTTATLQGDWMTDDMVPFTATLTFDDMTMANDDVKVILRKANPSGMPANDDSLALPVHFSK